MVTAIEPESEPFKNSAEIADTFQELLVDVLDKMHYQDKRMKYIENKFLEQSVLLEKTVTSLEDLGRRMAEFESSTRFARETDNPKKTVANIDPLQTDTRLDVQELFTVNHHLLKSRSLSRQHVAFSAYLSKTVDNVSIGQVIKCDAILLNDGNAYNPDLGVFTASENGVYIFSFAVASTTQTYVKLLVDGLNTAGVLVSHVGHNQTAMTSNTIIVRVGIGQSVWLENYINDDVTLVSFGPFIYTAFSGYQLY
ncbi:EMI domain [Mactra antiquata]